MTVKKPTGTRKKVKRKGLAKTFDKYELYHKAVQSCEGDVIFLRGVYKELRKKDAIVMREDFCGTFALSCEWVKLNPKFRAFGVDLDPEPIAYGREHYFSKLKPHQQARLDIREGNVMNPDLPSPDLAIAMNFSYFLFKTREALRAYFRNVHQSLRKDGVFVLDLFGGSLCFDANEEKTVHKGFAYYWDQEGFDPATNEAVFHIHFKLDGQRKQERVFSYDWRMWSIPELREILAEAGFGTTHLYWEGTSKDGGGDGKFTRVEKGESCQSWIAYIAAEI